MAIKAGPKIVDKGLVIALDAAVLRSYSGSGFTASGLIAGLGATLVNGTGFSTANNGFFSFDGTNDYINFGNPPEAQLSSGTICVWCRTSSPGAGYRGIVAKQFAYGLFYTDSVLVLYDWSIPRASSTGFNLADGIWKYISLTFTSGAANGSTVFLNGSGILTTSYTISNNSSNLFIGSEQNANQNANCNISQVQLYNRILSPQEILQNYNATKGRYGL